MEKEKMNVYKVRNVLRWILWPANIILLVYFIYTYVVK